jgi:hypothetical protein
MNQLRDVNTICRRSWYIAAHIWKIYDFKIEVVPFIINFSRVDHCKSHNVIGQKKKDKRTSHNLQNITQKTKDWATRTPQKTHTLKLNILPFSASILTFSRQNHLILTYFTSFDTTHFFYKYYNGLYQKSVKYVKIRWFCIEKVRIEALKPGWTQVLRKGKHFLLEQHEPH